MQPTLLGSMLKDHLPILFFKTSFLEVMLWQWACLFVLFLLSYLTSWYLTKLSIYIFRRLIIKQFPHFDQAILSNFISPLRIGFFIACFALSLGFIQLPTSTHSIFILITKLAFVFDVIWLSFRIVDAFGQWLTDRLTQKNKISFVTMLPLLRRVFKTSLVILAVLILLQNLGFEVTALIAGLGVGGIAIALAAQKTLENIFGGTMLILDQSVHVGDSCRFGAQQGTIEEIGLRSTKIRTLERTLISVPNSNLAQMELENFNARDRIRFYSIIGIRYETKSHQLRNVLSEIRELLDTYSNVDHHSIRVRFIRFGTYSLDIELQAYILTTDHEQFLSIRENILLRIMDVLEKNGTKLAFPSQTTYLATDSGILKNQATEN